jgi:formylglycine-generating enzyme
MVAPALKVAGLGAAVGVLFAAASQAQIGERVRIGAFEIDATEVTIAQFRAFAEATALETAAERTGGGFEWGAGWERRPGWTVYRPYSRDPDSLEEPAVHVSWHEAEGYCAWREGRLPTFAEWRRGAADREGDVAVQYQREYIKRMRMLGVVAAGRHLVGADLGKPFGAQPRFETDWVHALLQ